MRARLGLWLGLGCFLLLGLGGCAHQLGSVAGTGATALPQQIRSLVADATAPAEPRVIFIGVALNSRETVFDADVRLLDRLLHQRYGARYRSVLLSNQRIQEGDRDLPLATIEQVDQVFSALRQAKRPQDRFIVLFTTHGGPGLLEVEQQPFYKTPALLPSNQLKVWMEALAPNRTWLMLSACYSGSHLPALTQAHLLTMTASAADRPSFGCSNTEKNTWFVQALAENLAEPARSDSFDTLWVHTTMRLEMRELAGRFLPSRPQIQYGAGVQALRGEAIGDF